MPKVIHQHETAWSVEYVGPASAGLDELVFLRIPFTERVSATVSRGVWPRFTADELLAILEKARALGGVERIELVWGVEKPPDRLHCVGGPHDGEVRSREELGPRLDFDARRIKHYVRAPHGSGDVWLWQDQPMGAR